MKKDMNPLGTGLMRVNLAVLSFMIYIGSSVNHHRFGNWAVDLSEVGFVALATMLFVVVLVLGLRNIMQGKSQIKTLGRRKYFVFALNVAAFLILGLAFVFHQSSFMGIDLSLSFIGIFLVLELIPIFYYADISPLKDNQNQILQDQTRVP